MVIPVGGDSESYSNQVSHVFAASAAHVLYFCFLSGCDRLLIVSNRTCLLFKVVQEFRQAGFLVDLNSDQSATLNKKIRAAQLSQYNYIFGKGSNESGSLLNYRNIVRPLIVFPFITLSCRGQGERERNCECEEQRG